MKSPIYGYELIGEKTWGQKNDLLNGLLVYKLIYIMDVTIVLKVEGVIDKAT